MKLARMSYAPDALADFHAEGFAALGAVCERTWHDRLQVLAEGRAAALWPGAENLVETELTFVGAGATGARDARREVFPGCPLTFGLAEALRPQPLVLERVALAAEARSARLPETQVLEKLWRAQFPDTARWGLATPPVAAWHFSLVAWVRLEAQAIDQHWSMHRVALALPGGGRDENLAQAIAFATPAPAPEAARVEWPTPDASWSSLVDAALRKESEAELEEIRTRQQAKLQRELARVDDYFSGYEAELRGRVARTRSAEGAAKLEARLAAARAEHARHRADQVARHEIALRPHFDALLLVAEPAWQATVQLETGRVARRVAARFVPRARRWDPL